MLAGSSLWWLGCRDQPAAAERRQEAPESQLNQDAVLSVEPIGTRWPTTDPFLFCAYHLDAYPAGNAAMGPAASLDGCRIGRDFAGKDGWNMYHGEVIPGFPRHPHRGFETVTVVKTGLLDHADSLGATARYGDGDVQWLTAGGGIQHAEMFPLLNKDRDNPPGAGRCARADGHARRGEGRPGGAGSRGLRPGLAVRIQYLPGDGGGRAGGVPRALRQGGEARRRRVRLGTAGHDSGRPPAPGVPPGSLAPR